MNGAELSPLGLDTWNWSIQHRVIISNGTFKDTVILMSAICEGGHSKQKLTFNFQLQGEIGEPGQKGSKGDKGENVSSKILCPFCFS